MFTVEEMLDYHRYSGKVYMRSHILFIYILFNEKGKITENMSNRRQPYKVKWNKFQKNYLV